MSLVLNMLCNLPLGPNSHRQFSFAVIITILIPLCGESYFIYSTSQFYQVAIPLLQMRELKLRMVKMLPTTQMVEMRFKPSSIWL